MGERGDYGRMLWPFKPRKLYIPCTVLSAFSFTFKSKTTVSNLPDFQSDLTRTELFALSLSNYLCVCSAVFLPAAQLIDAPLKKKSLPLSSREYRCVVCVRYVCTKTCT